MVTKYLFCAVAVAVFGGAFANSCQNPQVEAASFTSLDATIVTHIAYITEFTLKCDNPLPENYALYAEVDGKSLTAARIGDNKYQPKDVHCWTKASPKDFHKDQSCAARIQAPPSTHQIVGPPSGRPAHTTSSGSWSSYYYLY